MFTYMRHAWPKPEGFEFEQPNGSNDVTFMHFFNSVELLTENGIVTTQPDACIFYGPADHQYYISRMPLLHDHLHATSDAIGYLQKYNIKTNIIYYPDSSFVPQITEMVKRIEYETYAPSSFSEDMLEALATEFFLSFSRNVNREEIYNSAENQIIAGVRHNVMTNISCNWTVERMAEDANLSVSRFHVLYKEQFGISPISELINARVQIAKGLLQNSSMQVRQIAEHLGYSNTFHFIRQFKKSTGQTPNEFRHKWHVKN